MWLQSWVLNRVKGPINYLLIFMMPLAMAGCDLIGVTFLESSQSQKNPDENSVAEEKLSYQEIEWTDLMPSSDLEALLNPPSYVTDIEDGAIDDVIASQLQSQEVTNPDDPYQQALVSTKIVTEMNNQAIRIPGFIVPLEYNNESKITEFFLVPFFGACIHVPPPPPNQIIFVRSEEGVEQKQLYDAYWISGTLSTTLIENDMATAAYSLQLDQYKPYYEDYELPQDDL